VITVRVTVTADISRVDYENGHDRRGTYVTISGEDHNGVSDGRTIAYYWTPSTMGTAVRLSATLELQRLGFRAFRPSDRVAGTRKRWSMTRWSAINPRAAGDPNESHTEMQRSYVLPDTGLTTVTPYVHVRHILQRNGVASPFTLQHH
jgi:hypothetical protein